MHTSFYGAPIYVHNLKKCTPIPAPAFACNLSKMHTYIYPVLTCCKKCIPIPATTAAGRFQKVYTYTGHNDSQQPLLKNVHLYMPRCSR